MRTIAPLMLLAVLGGACDQPGGDGRTEAPPAPDPGADAAAPFFVGRWAAAAAACGHAAWLFTATGLSTPGEVSCSFERVTPVAAGYDIAASCTAEGPPQPHRLKLSYAQSAQALLVEGGPFAPVGLIACDGQRP